MTDSNKWNVGWTMVAGNQISEITEPASLAQTRKARQLVMLGILLQALHILFGITAFIGVLVTQTHSDSAKGSVYESQLRWQFFTFWIGLSGYVVGFYLWVYHGSPWLIFLVLPIVLYRLAKSVTYWRAEQAMRGMFF